MKTSDLKEWSRCIDPISKWGCFLALTDTGYRYTIGPNFDKYDGPDSDVPELDKEMPSAYLGTRHFPGYACMEILRQHLNHMGSLEAMREAHAKFPGFPVSPA